MHVVQGPHSYVMHRTKRAPFWNSKTLVFLLPWKVNPLVSTADLSLQGTEAPAHLSPSTLAVTTLLTKQPPSCSLAPHQVSLNSSKWHLILWLAGRKRRLPVLKLHTLWSHPLDPLLHQLIQAISGSLIWHLLLTLRCERFLWLLLNRHRESSMSSSTYTSAGTKRHQLASWQSRSGTRRFTVHLLRSFKTSFSSHSESGSEVHICSSYKLSYSLPQFVWLYVVKQANFRKWRLL